MDFIEDIRVSEKGIKAGFCAEVNCPAAIFDAREICSIGIAKDPTA